MWNKRMFVMLAVSLLAFSAQALIASEKKGFFKSKLKWFTDNTVGVEEVSPGIRDALDPVSPFVWGEDFYSVVAKLCQSESIQMFNFRDFSFFVAAGGADPGKSGQYEPWTRAEVCDDSNYKHFIPSQYEIFQYEDAEVITPDWEYEINAISHDLGGIPFEYTFRFGVSKRADPFDLNARKVQLGYYLENKGKMETNVVLPLIGVSLRYPESEVTFPDLSTLQYDSILGELTESVIVKFKQKYRDSLEGKVRNLSVTIKEDSFELQHTVWVPHKYREGKTRQIIYDLVEVNSNGQSYLQIKYTIWAGNYFRWAQLYEEIFKAESDSTNLETL